MQITIELPDDIAKLFSQKGANLSRQTLEALAIEGYRSELLSHREVGRLLGLDWWGVENFLNETKVLLRSSKFGLEKDKAALNELRRLPTISETFDEIRQICVEENFEMTTPSRKDRLNPLISDDVSL